MKIEKYKNDKKIDLGLIIHNFLFTKSCHIATNYHPSIPFLLSIASPYFSSVYQSNCTYIQKNQKCKKISKFINPPIK
jgi:hypothetical protein